MGLAAILAIDAGTTGVTALVVDAEGRVAAQGYKQFPQHFPRPGWVEHQPEEIWQATLAACRQALRAYNGTLTAIGLTNQRETAVLWDRSTLEAPGPAIVWQDRRSAELCSQLRVAGHEDRLRTVTGLRLDPYFTGTKLAWLAESDPATWAGVTSGQVAVGTIDSYLVARLTDGARHVTDASNASRTLLFDIAAGEWSAEMCDLMRVPMSALPEVVSSYGVLGRTSPGAFLGLDLPIAGIAGDQQAALFGQACFADGESKCTYGTGSFILLNTGATPVRSDDGLLTTVAWMAPSGAMTYAIEGAIFVTGSAVQWLRDGLGIIDDAAETEAIASTVRDSGGVTFVPALTGLGAPDWDPSARGTIIGITRGTTRAHLVRATLEAIAFEVRDVVDLLPRISMLRVDGGASANNLLLQLQANTLGISVERPKVRETTALGAAFLAGLGTGMWSSTEELSAAWRLDRCFTPGTDADEGARHAAHRRWRRAVERAKQWEVEVADTPCP